MLVCEIVFTLISESKVLLSQETVGVIQISNPDYYKCSFSYYYYYD